MDLSDLAVVDGHAHPLFTDGATVAPETFLALFTEGRPGAMAGHVEHTRYLGRALRALASRIRAAEADGAEVWCIFDNTASGAAAGNALELRSLLEEGR